MKTLYLIIIYLLFAVLCNGQAEESRWVKNGAFWEHTNALTDIVISKDGKHFWAKDTNNLKKYLKFRMDDGTIVDSLIPKTHIPIDSLNEFKFFISKDEKTYILSYLLKEQNDKKSFRFEVKELQSHNLIKSILSDSLFENSKNTITYCDYNNKTDNFLVLWINFKYWEKTLYKDSYAYWEWVGKITIYNEFLASKSTINAPFNNDYYSDVTNKKILTYSQSKMDIMHNFQKQYGDDGIYYLSLDFETRKSNRISENYYIKNVKPNCSISPSGNIISYQPNVDSLITIKNFDLSDSLVVNLKNKIVDYFLLNDTTICFISNFKRDSSNKLLMFNIKTSEFIKMITIPKTYKFNYLSLINSYYSDLFLTTTDKKLLKINYDSLEYVLIPEFYANDTLQYVETGINFQNLSWSKFDSCKWDFGDGYTSNQINPTHQYKNPGLYSVSLTLNKSDSSKSESKQNYIRILPKMKAVFEVEKVTGLDTLNVFTKNLSYGNITSFKWFIADSIFTVKEPNITIYKPGYYDVTLIVSDGFYSDTLTKVDYLNVIQSPIDNEYIDIFSTFTNSLKHCKPAIITEHITNKYVIGYTLDTINNSLSYNGSIFELQNNFKESSLIIEDKYSSKPDKLFINSDNQAVMSLLRSQYLIYYDFKNKKKSKFEDIDIFIELFSKNKNCLALCFNWDMYNSEIILKKLKNDLSLQQIFRRGLKLNDYGELVGIGNIKYILENNYLLTFLNYFERKYDQTYKDFDYYKTSSVYIMEYEIKDSIYNISYSKEQIFANDYSSTQPALDIFINDAKSVKPNTIGFLTNGNNLKLYKKEPQNLKEIAVKSINSNCIYPYNDSLFLAGGSINGKATLFFLSTEDLAIKKTVTLNSLYGDITSIERASDGEFLLLAENKINKKFDSFLALKTKNLGKDAYPIDTLDSVKNPNDTTITFKKQPISNGKLINNMKLVIDLDSTTLPTMILEIYDFMGRKLVSTNELVIDTKTKQVTCDLSQFGNEITERAIYFYILRDSGNVLSGKFMR